MSNLQHSLILWVQGYKQGFRCLKPAFFTFLGMAFITPLASYADAMLITQKGNGRGAPACVTCHGTQGEGMPGSGFPRLANLNSDYLLSQLNAFASGQRANAMMTPIAQTLTAVERAELASYYSTMPRTTGPASTDTAPTPPPDSPGAQLALKGRWSAGLPACVQCHGASGAGVGQVFPALAGQSAQYIEHQLRNWQQGTRPPGPLGLMKVIVSKLSATDIRLVATYFAALSPAPPDTTRKP